MSEPSRRPLRGLAALLLWLAEHPALDYLDRDCLLDLGIDAAVVDRLLASSPLTGHDGRRVVEAARLPDLLAQTDPDYLR